MSSCVAKLASVGIRGLFSAPIIWKQDENLYAAIMRFGEELLIGRELLKRSSRRALRFGRSSGLHSSTHFECKLRLGLCFAFQTRKRVSLKLLLYARLLFSLYRKVDIIIKTSFLAQGAVPAAGVKLLVSLASPVTFTARRLCD